MIYKIVESDRQQVVIRNNANGTSTSFGLWPINADYRQFKEDLTNGAELQDVDGNAMTTEAVAEFLKTLP